MSESLFGQGSSYLRGGLPAQNLSKMYQHLFHSIVVCLSHWLISLPILFSQKDSTSACSEELTISYAGPYACVGKQFALMELRRVVAEILTRYDVSFAPDQMESAFWDGKRDTFTLVTAPLQLIFKKREGKEL